jgi:hypothetical protein
VDEYTCIGASTRSPKSCCGGQLFQAIPKLRKCQIDHVALQRCMNRRYGSKVEYRTNEAICRSSLQGLISASGDNLNWDKLLTDQV